MHAQRRYATCLGMSKKKIGKREKKPFILKEKKKRDGSYKGVHTPSTKNIHTLAYLDQGLWLVSPLDPVFDLAKYEKQICLQILHTYSSTKIAIRDRLRKKGTIKSLGEGLYTLSNPRDHPRNFIIFFWKTFTKPPDWRLNWRERNMSTLWYRSNSQPPKMRWSYKPHRSKVRGKNKRPTYSKSR